MISQSKAQVNSIIHSAHGASTKQSGNTKRAKNEEAHQKCVDFLEEARRILVAQDSEIR